MSSTALLVGYLREHWFRDVFVSVQLDVLQQHVTVQLDVLQQHVTVQLDALNSST
jgi:hypothetical protein